MKDIILDDVFDTPEAQLACNSADLIMAYEEYEREFNSMLRAYGFERR